MELANALVEMEGREKEIAMLKQKMGNLLQEREGVVNRGKTVSAKQQPRKLSHFRNVSEAALWFADSFGLVVDQLQWRSQAGAHWGTYPSNWKPCPTGAGTRMNYRR